MQKPEKEKLVARLRRAADAQRRAYSGNLYHEGIAQGLDDAAGILGKVRCEDGAHWIPCKELAREMLADKTVNILYDHYECSLCRFTIPNLLYNQDGEPFLKFCPNCGAKMEGDTDATD